MSQTTQGDTALEDGFWVEAWFVEPQSNSLTKGEETHKVEPKVMQVLMCLAERPGKAVTKEHFMHRVWYDTVVTDDVLARCISELRKVFGDRPRNPRFIETIRKSGYRLIAPVAPAKARSDGVMSTNNGYALPPTERARPRRLAVPKSFLWAALGVILLAVGGGTAWFWWISEAGSPQPLKAVPFTSFPGEELEPSPSPDGEQVAFVWNGGSGENYDVYIKQNGAETPLRLTEDPAREGSPTWAPDGRSIAFFRCKEEGCSIYTIPGIGGTERELAGLQVREIRGLVWSPDGKDLALSARNAPHEAFSIYLFSLENLQTRQLTSPPAFYRGDFGPAFAPNGTQVAFIRSVVEGMEDIYVTSLEDGSPRRLTSDNLEIRGLDWTPSGRNIVFASNREGMSSLWRVPASGGNPEWIAAAGESGSAYRPSISREAGHLTYEQRTIDTNVWQYRRVNSYRFASTRLISSTRWDSNPQYAPDGGRIAFASRRSGNQEIWVVDADGSNPVRLTFFDAPATGTPRWSPDGRFIAFESRREDNADIYVIDVAGGLPRRLTETGEDEIMPSWSRDGQWVYFASNRESDWQIWKMPSEGGEAVRITEHGGTAAIEAPDGQSLYVVKNDTAGVWRVPIEGGPEELVMAYLEPVDAGNWSVQEDGIYFIRRRTAGPTVELYSFADGLIYRVATLENMPEHPSFSISPDRNAFLVTQIERSESDILVLRDFQ